MHAENKWRICQCDSYWKYVKQILDDILMYRYFLVSSSASLNKLIELQPKNCNQGKFKVRRLNSIKYKFKFSLPVVHLVSIFKYVGSSYFIFLFFFVLNQLGLGFIF